MLRFFDYEMIPIAFYPYTSSVRERIFETEYSSETEIDKFEHDLISMFNEAGINAYRDNKIAFEVEIRGKRMFYGFYDWKFSIGFSVYSENKPVTKTN